MNSITDLRRKRGVYKSKLTLFTTYVESILMVENPTKAQLHELALRLEKNEDWYNEFDLLQIEIESFTEISDTEREREYEYRGKFEVEYFATVSRAREYASRFAAAQPRDFASAESLSGVAGTAGMANIKLPTVNLPVFSGSFENWLEFHDTFLSLIHSNTSIPNIHKFHYLRSSLKESAASVISSLDFSSDNYEVAWKLLRERYHNNKVLISNHIQAILDLEPSSRESSVALRLLIDTINKNLRCLQTLKVDTQTWDILIIHLVSAKLDNSTARRWKEHSNTLETLPNLEEFLTFIKNRAEVLESITQVNTRRRYSEPAMSKPRAFVVNSEAQHAPKPYTCYICKQNHSIFQCPRFKTLSVRSRIQKANQLRLCLNCLRYGHDVKHCKSSSCKICAKRHNTLLHIDNTYHKGPSAPTDTVAAATDNSIQISPTQGTSTNTQKTYKQTKQDESACACLSSIHNSNHVLLSTVLINLTGRDGKQHTVRALLDNGSTSNFMTEELCSRLNLPVKVTSTAVQSLSREPIHIKNRITVKISSRTEHFTSKISCFVVPHITQCIPTTYIDIKHVNIPNNLLLADPSFYKPSEVDMLLGADIFWTTLRSERFSLGKNMPILNNSSFGWLVSGAMLAQTNTHKKSTVHCNFINEIELKTQLDRFFELESVPSNHRTKQESECESHFIKTTTRQEDGRFVVQIPFKQSPSTLGDSYNQAFNRLLSLERKLHKSPSLKQEYDKFMQEYIDLNHMSPTKSVSDSTNSCFLSHHGVLRESSLTTRLRCVFDASAKTSSGLSLNDIQHVGPVVQDDLISILIRFRQHKYVVTSDCEKMYRSILIHESQRHLQQILWRFDPSQGVQNYTLNTVTYGTSSAPYLATRCLQQIGLETVDSLVRETILKDFYVDDYISGHDSKSALLHIIQSVIHQLKGGQLYLRKWRSNCPELLVHISSEGSADSLLTLSNENHAKTLGLHWSCASDTLHYSPTVNQSLSQHNTNKRSVLSTISQIFDPLGLINPCTLQGKIIVQKIWTAKLSWDDELPPDLERDWISFQTHLSQVAEISIPRHALCNSPALVEIHAFSDASSYAYSACIYLRSISVSGSITINLAMAKSKVLPIKGLTIPRAELAGALIAARLASKVKTALRITVHRTVYWCDSTIVLGWIRSPKSSLKTFVLNRINEISELTTADAWKYVPTNLNPADIGSRGCTARHLKDSKLWFHGPDFLHFSEHYWPEQPFQDPLNLPETKVQCNLITDQDNILLKYSNFNKLQNIIAYLKRFIHNCKNPHNKQITPYLSVNELNEASTTLCKIAQLESFPKEYNFLQQQKPLPAKTQILNLNPFLSQEGLIRVGGRLSNSHYDYNTKHPILLHASHYLATLIVRHYHKMLLHSGPQLTMSIIRHKFWIIGGRNLTRKVTHDCIVCRRFAGKSIQPIMADLPKERLQSNYPFMQTSVDYCGPILIADRKGRGCKLQKAYISVFVCLAVRAIHLELVTELTTAAFIAALNRFISRRGKPATVFSDNGTCFRGACTELSKFFKTKCNDISTYAATQAINFHFFPPYSPHFNGLSESSVKSVKHHLKRVLALAHLTYEEMNTVLVQIEGILNSRPLTPLSSNPNDLIPLTPSHFLIGRTIETVPQPGMDATEPSSITTLPRYKRAQALTTHFWNRFKTEYISELQRRTKWQRKGEELKKDDLVIVKDDRLPPNRWLLGRIIQLHPGVDGIARVADITTSNGIITRAYNRLCLLPTQL